MDQGSAFRIEGLGFGGWWVGASILRVKGQTHPIRSRLQKERVSDFWCRVYGVGRYRANVAHIRQSRPDSGIDFQVKGLFNVSRCSLFAGKRFRIAQT